jgi:MFS family permease
MTSSVADLLSSRRFGPLFATQFLGAFNDNLLKSALGVLAAYRLAEQSGIDAGALAMVAGALFIAPFVLFSGAAGTLADRIDKSRIARGVKLAEIVIMLFGGAALVMENLPALLAALFLLGLHSTVFGPVKYALLPQHLADADLVAGNALVDAGTFLAILLGTLLGSALILASGGATWVGAIGVGAAIVGWIAARALPPAAPLDPAAVPRPRLLADGVAVIRHVAGDAALRGPILALSWFWALGGAVVAGLPVLARDTLGADESAVTLMLAIFALGVGAGSMLANRVLGGSVTARPVPWAGLAMAACALVVAAGRGAGADSHLALPRGPGRAGDRRRGLRRPALRGAAQAKRCRAPRPRDRGEQHRQCLGDDRDLARRRDPAGIRLEHAGGHRPLRPRDARGHRRLHAICARSARPLRSRDRAAVARPRGIS